MGSLSSSYLNKLHRLKIWSMIFCILGLTVSLYAYYVETKKENDDSYVAMCDISEHMSCSKAFTSEYGKGFGILQKFFDEDSPVVQPNSLYGIGFYIALMILGLANYVFLLRLHLWLCVLSNFGSVYLAYILYFVLYDFCVVCVTMYVINFILLIVSYLRLSTLKSFYQETGGPILYGGGSISKKRV